MNTIPQSLNQAKNMFAIKLRHDWNLNNTYRFYLRNYYILRWEKQYFLSSLTHTDGIPEITREGITYQVHCYNSGTIEEVLAESGNTLLLSFRNPSTQCKYPPVVLIKNGI